MAAHLGHDAAEAPRGRPPLSSNHPQRLTRSWTSNGVHYTVDSTTYTAPGFSFGAFSGTANGPYVFDPFMTSSREFATRPAPFALLGNAFGLLEDAFTMRPQHAVVGDSGLGQGARRRIPVDPPAGAHELELIYEEDNFAANRKARRKSIFTRLKDRLVDVNQIRRQHSLSSRERSSEDEHARIPSRTTSTRVPPDGPSPPAAWAAPQEQGRDTARGLPPEYIEVDYQDGTTSESEPEPEYTHNRSRPRSHQYSTVNNNMVEALENAVELERRNARACKQRLAQVSRQGDVNSNYLQRIVDELKQHEATLATATSNLNEAKARQMRGERQHLPRRTSTRTHAEMPPPPPPQMPPRRPSQERSRSRPRYSQSSYNMRDRFVPADDFAGFPDRSAHPDPIFQAFNDLHGEHAGMHFDPFHHYFGTDSVPMDDSHIRFSTMPDDAFSAASDTRRKRATFNPGGPRASFQQPRPSYRTSFAPPPRRTPAAPKPPATVLTSEEAKRLFVIYDEKWKALPASNPDIPYPARGLHAGGLVARDSLWAPNISTHVASWSEETVMQANAQAFYLGVVGLAPRYTHNSASGRVEVGFDKSRATPSQLQQLVDMLKKEKIRWHSDRLGRRNGGRAGPNEALQKDERARAVFHAVCELMESAQ
ncbi:hypothetical protein CERZMDRAFT_96567 [Cercospora zeae-maydis SCOH1-5]|uniref:Uncharacterized protein n=1 Tax=Cercospora zeae-maydis SCOH1-5 TaxID=717836 RepID=A0A6A6FJX3_9PEZI|nr:hypothetical protein CERZMDRAFT_96567 [Cercospora zeae-maydis SCOH1-5]